MNKLATKSKPLLSHQKHLRGIVLTLYLLFIAGVSTVILTCYLMFLPGFFTGVLVFMVAIFIGRVKKDDAVGTVYHSRHREGVYLQHRTTGIGPILLSDPPSDFAEEPGRLLPP